MAHHVAAPRRGSWECVTSTPAAAPRRRAPRGRAATKVTLLWFGAVSLPRQRPQLRVGMFGGWRTSRRRRPLHVNETRCAAQRQGEAWERCRGSRKAPIESSTSRGGFGNRVAERTQIAALCEAPAFLFGACSSTGDVLCSATIQQN
jgi:hypothetical protein